MNIVGAGLTGLIAAHAWPKASVLEMEAGPRVLHKALLRFRTEKVSHLTGIPFKNVAVRKGIYSNGAFVNPSIRLANQYAFKVTGENCGDRSIWNLDPVTRFIAPDDFYEQLVDQVGSRIIWNCESRYVSKGDVVTIPLNAALEPTSIRLEEELSFRSIGVARYKISNTDLYQTIYFPDADTPLYRASITGGVLTLEMTDDFELPRADSLVDALNAFGLDAEATLMDTTNQRYGKIVPLPKRIRQSVCYEYTNETGAYLLGRFATWRNILLDDAADDIQVIKKLMGSEYHRRKDHVPF